MPKRLHTYLNTGSNPSRRFLKNTDYKIARHMEESELGLKRKSLSAAEYADLLKARQAARKKA